MTFKETLDYLYSRLPMFHRIGAAAYKADLNNTYAIMNLLGHPEQKFKSIHIAGTNGKGSSSHMIASILQEAGYKVGLYTSPHLVDFRERIRINGKMIPKKAVTEFVLKHKAEMERIEPSFFEWTVGLCFDFFAKQKVDVAVVEVGLGGRLDSTNVLRPEVCLITNISYDHANLLGNTLEKIAGEKAGIIKPEVPVVISQKQPDLKNVFFSVAKHVNAPVIFASDSFKVIEQLNTSGLLNLMVSDIERKKSLSLKCPLAGSYQSKNIIGVLEVIRQMRHRGFKITDTHIKAGIKQVIFNTGLSGRWQVILKKPYLVGDTGHNEDGIKNVLDTLNSLWKQGDFGRLRIVFGMVNDKNPDKVLHVLQSHKLARKAEFYFCSPSIPRGLPGKELQGIAKEFNLHGQAYLNVKTAVKAALNDSEQSDFVLVTGSTFVVSDLLKDLKNILQN